MKYKKSNNEYNEIFREVKQDLDNTKNKIENIKNDIQEKMKIIKYENEYMNKIMLDSKANIKLKDKLKTYEGIHSDIMKFVEPSQVNFSDVKNGVFNKYGNTVSAAFLKEPHNVFNLRSSGTGEYFFRNDVDIVLQDEQGNIIKENKIQNINMLKHDSIDDKKIIFNNFRNKDINKKEYIFFLTISINEKNKLGSTLFNMIELNSFLPGSFDIISIILNNDKPDLREVYGSDTNPYMRNAGMNRIILTNNNNNNNNCIHELHNITFKIKCNYQASDYTFPFGIKHIYFLKSYFKKDSFILAKIKNKNYISIIHDKCLIETHHGTKLTTLTDENIEVYSIFDKEKNEFKDRIYPSTPTKRNDIISNITEVYMKIPLQHNDTYKYGLFTLEPRI